MQDCKMVKKRLKYYVVMSFTAKKIPDFYFRLFGFVYLPIVGKKILFVDFVLFCFVIIWV